MPVNFHLTAGEIAYIAAESGARLVRRLDHRERDVRGGRGRRAGGRAARRRHHRRRPRCFVGDAADKLRPDQRRAPQPAVHVRHDRAAQGGPAPAEDDRRLARPGRVHRPHLLPPARQARDSSRRRTALPQRSADGGPPVAGGCAGVVHERFDAEATLAAIASTRSRARSWCPPISCAAWRCRARSAIDRRVVAAAGRPHRGKCRDRGQARDDRVVGTGAVRVVRWHRIGHGVLDQLDRLAGPPWVGGPRRAAVRGARSSTTPATNCRRRPRGGSTSGTPPAAASSTKVTPEDGRRPHRAGCLHARRDRLRRR